MSFFESEYFPTSSNDEVGNGGGESSTYPITDTLLEADNVLGSSASGDSHGNLMDEGDLFPDGHGRALQPWVPGHLQFQSQVRYTK